MGLAYKQIIDYPKALENLRDAVTLHPKIKEALVELIDVALLVGEMEEAKKWIEVAEKEQIFPAKIAFLKGLVLKKERKNMEAIESFERAKALEETLSQSADFQIVLCYLEERGLGEAKERLRLGPPRARRDKFYQGSADLTREFYKHTTLVLQFIAIRDDSNLPFFDYDRQIYIAGVEYTF